jgi:hypothetical protein
MDTHDAVTLELEDTESSILEGLELLRDSFDRTFTFPNGTKIKIPIEFTLGYDLRNEEEFKNESELKIAYRKIQNNRAGVLGVA